MCNWKHKNSTMFSKSQIASRPVPSSFLDGILLWELLQPIIAFKTLAHFGCGLMCYKSDEKQIWPSWLQDLVLAYSARRGLQIITLFESLSQNKYTPFQAMVELFCMSTKFCLLIYLKLLTRSELRYLGSLSVFWNFL